MNKHRATKIETAARLGACRFVFLIVRDRRIVNRPVSMKTEFTLLVDIVDPFYPTRIWARKSLTYTVDNVDFFNLREAWQQLIRAGRYHLYDEYMKIFHSIKVSDP